MDWLGTTCLPRSMWQYTWYPTKNLPTKGTTHPTQQEQQKRHTEVSRIIGSTDDSISSPTRIDNMRSRRKSSRRFRLNLSRIKITRIKYSRAYREWIDGIYHGSAWKDQKTNQRSEKSVIQRGLQSQIADITIIQKYRVRRATRGRYKISMATGTNTSAEIRPNKKMRHLQGWMQGVNEERQVGKTWDNFKTNFTES